MAEFENVSVLISRALVSPDNHKPDAYAWSRVNDPDTQDRHDKWVPEVANGVAAVRQKHRAQNYAPTGNINERGSVAGLHREKP